MRFIIQAAVVVTLLAPAVVGAQQVSDREPVCRGSMDGGRLTTVVQFEDGYTVEAPWEVMQNRAGPLAAGGRGIQMGARLDRIIEVDPSTGARQATPFPNPVNMTFEGRNRDELISRAAQIWCASVLKARADRAKDTPSDDAPHPLFRTT
jgi:hypothetical protein